MEEPSKKARAPRSTLDGGLRLTPLRLFLTLAFMLAVAIAGVGLALLVSGRMPIIPPPPRGRYTAPGLVCWPGK